MAGKPQLCPHNILGVAKCIECRRERQNRYYQRNKEKIRKRDHERYLKNRERIKARNKAWRINNIEKYRAYSREYMRNRYNNDPEFRARQLKAVKKWDDAHPEKKLEHKRNSRLRKRKLCPDCGAESGNFLKKMAFSNPPVLWCNNCGYEEKKDGSSRSSGRGY